jgi:hypothetical protein
VSIGVPPMRLQIPSAYWILSLAPPLRILCSVQCMAVRVHFYNLSGTGRASQETAISGSCQEALVGIRNSVWVWRSYIGWIPRWGSLWMVIPSVSASHFLSVTHSMSILFPLLRIEVSTLWSSLFLSFTYFANCILGIPSFWANICLSASAYHGHRHS